MYQWLGAPHHLLPMTKITQSDVVTDIYNKTGSFYAVFALHSEITEVPMAALTPSTMILISDLASVELVVTLNIFILLMPYTSGCIGPITSSVGGDCFIFLTHLLKI